MAYPYKSFEDWLNDEERIGNVVRINSPIKCGDYSSIVPIGNGIPGKQPETEMRAVSRYLHSLPGKPIGILENPVDNRPDIPVIVNPWPSGQRVLRGMGFATKDDLCRKIIDIPNNRIKPLKVDKATAPCKEVIISGQSVDLRSNIPRVWVEFHQCLWSGFNGTAIIHDPDTGSHSLGKIRVGQYEWQNADPAKPFPEERVKTCMYAAISRGGTRPTNTSRWYLRHLDQNKPVPGAFVFGSPPDLHIVAALKTLPWPENGDEYNLLGGFRGEAVDVVESETIPGLYVPAHSHWVLEGEFLPEGEKLPEFAGDDNFIPYIVGGGVYTVFKVQCITHRRKPLWTASLSSSGGLHGQEGTHSGLACLNLEAEAINHLRGLGFFVKDVALLSGPLVTVIQLEVDGTEKPFPSYGKKVGMALAAYGVHVSAPYILVVGPDIDPHNGRDVLWALGMLSKPVTDAVIMKDGMPGIDIMLGLSSRGNHALMNGEQMIIDATTPVPERYAAWRPRSDPPEWEKEAIEKMKKKVEER